ncbi:hypothetical protein QQ045_032084 [Rhodiola kirilowii]
MDRGWGLTTVAESDRLTNPFFSSKTSVINSFHDLKSSGGNNMFPVSLSGRRDEESGRRVVDEVDFFSGEREKAMMRDGEKISRRDRSGVSIKEEVLHGEPILTESDLNVNTRLYLLTANAGSDQSTLKEDRSSLDEKRAKDTQVMNL